MANLTSKQRFARVFGKNIRDAREARKWGLKQLQAKSDVDMGNLSKTERGMIVPRLDTACRIADALAVPLDKLRPR